MTSINQKWTEVSDYVVRRGMLITVAAVICLVQALLRQLLADGRKHPARGERDALRRDMLMSLALGDVLHSHHCGDKDLARKRAPRRVGPSAGQERVSGETNFGEPRRQATDRVRELVKPMQGTLVHQ